MAIQSQDLYYDQTNGSVTFTYDDVSRVIQTVTVNVNPGQTIHATITRTDTGQTFSGAFTATQTFNVAAQNILWDKSGAQTFTASIY